MTWDAPANINDTDIDHYKLTIGEQEKIVHGSTREIIIEIDKDVNITLVAFDICGKESGLHSYTIKHFGPIGCTCTTQETIMENECTDPTSMSFAVNIVILVFLSVILILQVILVILIKCCRTQKQNKVSITTLFKE